MPELPEITFNQRGSRSFYAAWADEDADYHVWIYPDQSGVEDKCHRNRKDIESHARGHSLRSMSTPALRPIRDEIVRRLEAGELDRVRAKTERDEKQRQAEREVAAHANEVALLRKLADRHGFDLIERRA